MDVRLIAASLLFAAAAVAQDPKPQGQPPQPAPAPAPAPAPEAKPQDPDRPKPTPAQVVEELTKERDRLSREIAYAKDRAKGAKVQLSERMKPHSNTFRAIDAGVVATPVPAAIPQPTPPRAARLGTADEFRDHPADTMMLVNGRPVSRGSYDQMMEFGKTSGTPGDQTHRTASVLFELIQVEAVASAFEDNEAAARASEIAGQLEAGKPVADLAKEVGVVPGASPDGRFDTTRNSMFGVRFAQAAFSTEAGKRAQPFRNANGVVLLQVDKVTKGATPDLDAVSGTAIQVPYSMEPGVVQKAQLAVNTAQVDIVVKDKEILEALPQMFRRDAAPMMIPAPVQSRDVVALRAEVERLNAEMQKLAGKDDDASKAQRQALEMQYATTKRQLRAAEAGAPNTSTDGDVKKEPAPKEEPKKPPSNQEGPKQEAPPKQN